MEQIPLKTGETQKPNVGIYNNEFYVKQQRIVTQGY